MIAGIDALPSLPALYLELAEELQSEDASIAKVADIVAKDPGLSVKLLKLVNSSFFGLPQRIADLAKAVSLVGLEMICAIVLASGTFNKFKSLRVSGFSLETMWQHAMTVASLARLIAQLVGLDRKAGETVFMAGLLHDIGKLLIAAHLTPQYARIVEHARTHEVSIAQAELEVIGTTHAAVGAYLLGLWGLPDPIIEAAAFHHTPALRAASGFGPVAIIHVANAFANAGGELADFQRVVAGLDMAMLAQLGCLDEFHGWRRACADHLASG